MEKLFKLAENKTNVRTEVIAGVTTFLTMSYIIFVQPAILSNPFGSNMDFESVFMATCLAAAVATFLNRNRWLVLLRDPGDPELGSVRWELDADGEFRTQLASRDDVRAFSCGFVVRGFDVDEGLPLDASAIVLDPELQLRAFEGGAS